MKSRNWREISGNIPQVFQKEISLAKRFIRPKGLSSYKLEPTELSAKHLPLCWSSRAIRSFHSCFSFTKDFLIVVSSLSVVARVDYTPCEQEHRWTCKRSVLEIYVTFPRPL